jgi:hypothetical protein
MLFSNKHATQIFSMITLTHFTSDDNKKGIATCYSKNKVHKTMATFRNTKTVQKRSDSYSQLPKFTITLFQSLHMTA